MKEIIEQVSIILSCVALIILLCLLVVNLYLIKKNGFYVNVNCWFCNQWSKVLYKNRNSFNCPSCTQYNGFNEDGGYNKDIPEQHHIKRLNASRFTNYSNGLCHNCNNNQQLKVMQLSQFVPLNEENYDQEIEHFQKQLEKSYKLCKKCDKVLTSTLKKQDASLFGARLRELKKKGMDFLDLNSSSGSFSKKDKQNFASKMAHHTLNVFSMLILCNSLFVKADFVPKNYESWLPEAVLPYIVVASDFSKLVTNTTVSFIRKNKVNFIPENISFRVSHMRSITAVGFILQLVLNLWERKTWVNFNRTLCWTILLLSSWILRKEFFVYINILQTFCSLYHLYTGLFLADKPKMRKVLVRNSMRYEPELVSDVEEDAFEEENLSNSSKTSCSSSKGCCCNCTKGNQMFANNTLYKVSPSLPINLNNSFRSNYSFQTCKNNSFQVNQNNSFTSFKTGYQDFNSLFNGDADNISVSMENLSLGGFSTKQVPTRFYSPPPQSRRPILSPSKFGTNQNSWLAGGFYSDFDGSVPVYTSQLSRSSSQSSGFVSQNNDQTLTNIFNTSPKSQNGSIHEADKLSVYSEPAYHFKPISPRPQLPYDPEKVFYPALNPNKTLFLSNNQQEVFSLHNYPGKGRLFKTATNLNVSDRKFSQSVC